MKIFFYAMVLVLVWAISAPAAVVYLKDGGQIRAQKVWREKGQVVVLVNHTSIASFALSEINLKKTFPLRKKKQKPVAETVVIPATAGAATQENSAAAPKKNGKKMTLPRFSVKLPEREIPKGEEEGTLRKQKREMEERMKD